MAQLGISTWRIALGLNLAPRAGLVLPIGCAWTPPPSVQVKKRVAERERIQPEAVLSLVNSIYLTARESCSDLASSMKTQSSKLHSSTDRELMLKLSSLKGVKLSCLPGNRSDTDLARVSRFSPPRTFTLLCAEGRGGGAVPGFL